MAESKHRPARGAHCQVQDGALVRDREFCPRCGPGTFLAVHADRTSCRRCDYTEFNR